MCSRSSSGSSSRTSILSFMDKLTSATSATSNHTSPEKPNSWIATKLLETMPIDVLSLGIVSPAHNNIAAARLNASTDEEQELKRIRNAITKAAKLRKRVSAKRPPRKSSLRWLAAEDSTHGDIGFDRAHRRNRLKFQRQLSSSSSEAYPLGSAPAPFGRRSVREKGGVGQGWSDSMRKQSAPLLSYIDEEQAHQLVESSPNSPKVSRPRTGTATTDPREKVPLLGAEEPFVAIPSSNHVQPFPGFPEKHKESFAGGPLTSNLSFMGSQSLSPPGFVYPPPRRLIDKNGHCNVTQEHIRKQHWRYLRDIFNTLVDAKWRWSLLVFTCAYFISWTLFGLVYYAVAAYRGDLWNIVQPDANHTACLTNIHSFTSAFLYSVETQTTVGYGYRYTTEECPEAIILMGIQSILGIMIQTFMTGFVFAKMARPEKRAETLVFSDKAVISMRDGRLCFLFRVGDMRKSHIVEAHIRLQMIKKRMTKEGELHAFHQFDMNVGYELGLDRIFLVWPLTICHVIDEFSPLYDYSAEDLANARFEIVAILEGVVESRGMTTQARTSYLANEVYWGYRFDKLVTYTRHDGDYRIDFDRFHSIHPVDTLKCSAKQLDRFKAMEESLVTHEIPEFAQQSSTIGSASPGNSGGIAIERLQSVLDSDDGGIVESFLYSGDHPGAAGPLKPVRSSLTSIGSNSNSQSSAFLPNDQSSMSSLKRRGRKISELSPRLEASPEEAESAIADDRIYGDRREINQRLSNGGHSTGNNTGSEICVCGTRQDMPRRMRSASIVMEPIMF